MTIYNCQHKQTQAFSFSHHVHKSAEKALLSFRTMVLDQHMDEELAPASDQQSGCFLGSKIGSNTGFTKVFIGSRFRSKNRSRIRSRVRSKLGSIYRYCFPCLRTNGVVVTFIPATDEPRVRFSVGAFLPIIFWKIFSNSNDEQY